MHWLVFAAISVFVGSIGNLIRRSIMGKSSSDPLVSAVFVQLIASAILGLYTMTRTFQVPSFGEYWANYILMAVCWSIATYAIFVVYKYVEAGEATILGSLSSIVSIIGGVLILKEPFTTQNLFGVVCILAAVVLIGKASMKHFVINKGFFYAITASFFTGIGIVNDSYMLRRADGLSYLFLAFVVPGIVLFLINFKKLAFTIHHHKRSFWAEILIQGFFLAISAAAFYTAMDRNAPASQLSPITQSSIILTVILGMIFLNERKHMKTKLLSAILVFAGVLLLG